MNRHFEIASWDIFLQLITTSICILAIGMIIYNPDTMPILIWGGIIVGSALFMVRGYSIQNSTLIIQRLGWTTEFDLTNLKKVELKPGAMKKSWRTFGIGGLFGWIGKFYNNRLGSYRAYATNRYKCVVLELEETKLIVTPKDPARFVETVEEFL